MENKAPEYSHFVRGIVEKIPEQSELRRATDQEVLQAEGSLLSILSELSVGYELSAADEDVLSVLMERVHDEACVRRARVCPNAMIEYVVQDEVTGEPVRQADIHKKWQSEMGKHEQLLILGPREHGKSGQVVGRCLWEIGKNQNVRIKIVSNTDTEAGKRVSEIAAYIEENERYRRVFPKVRPTVKGKWSGQRIFIQRTRQMREPTVEGYGVLSAGTGGRCDLLVLDDVVDRKNALQEPGKRESIKTAVRTDWLALLSSKSWVVSIATLWHKKDFNSEIGGEALKEFLKGKTPDQSEIEPGDWFVCFDAVGENFEPVWAEHWPVERLKAKYRQVGRSAFNRGWRNMVIDDGETVMEQEWIRYYKQNDLPHRSELIIVQSYDLSISKKEKKRHSYFACVTLAVILRDTMPEVYVMDAHQRRCGFPEQLAIIKAGFERVKPDVILVESVAYQEALSQQLLHTTILPVIPVVPNGNKHMRLESVSPLFQNGMVFFSERLDPDKNLKVQWRGDVVGQLLDFPFGDGDDLVDALSQGIRYMQENAVAWSGFKRGEDQTSRARVFSIDENGLSGSEDLD